MIRSFHYSNQKRLINVCKRLPTTASRQLSSLQPLSEAADKKDRNDDTVRLLYQRDEERNTLPKSSFLLSSLNSIYWVWYVLDFVPAANASPIESFHIDPIYGYGGLGLSILIQSAFTLYPLSLVSKIAYRTTTSASTQSDGKNDSTPPNQQEILVWKYTLPLLRTSSTPLVFPAGGITLDKTSENTRIILEDHGGNFANFEGFLGLKTVPGKETKSGGSNSGLASYLPLLVDIRKPSEVYDSESMLKILLSGGSRKHHNHKGSQRRRSARESDEEYPKKFQQQRPKYQKKKRHRGKKN